MTWLLVVTASIVSFAAGWAASGYRVGQRQAAVREMQAQLGRPLDLEPCEFTHLWREAVP